MVNPVVTPTASGRLSSARTAAERAPGSSQSSALIQRKSVPLDEFKTRFMFSLMPMLTALKFTVTRRSYLAYSCKVSTVSSSEALSEITSSRSLKSCVSTDSMQRRVVCGAFRTARPTERTGMCPLGIVAQGCRAGRRRASIAVLSRLRQISTTRRLISGASHQRAKA